MSTLGLTAREAGLAACRYCGALHKTSELQSCRRCGGAVHQRKPHSLQRTWAFLLLGIMAYIPANTYPIMATEYLGSLSRDTIMSGVVVLFRDGSYFVSIIVFVASVCIPVGKFVIIAGLALSLHFQWSMTESTRHTLHSITEIIGRWSMIDVFVVAVLAALIQLGALLNISPEVGINAFAASVVFTMFSANSLDPRLFWDK